MCLVFLQGRSTLDSVKCSIFCSLLDLFRLCRRKLRDSALAKMRAASNDALVQRTLHPPKIPRKSLAGLVKAGSLSASSVDRGGSLPVVPRSQSQAI